MLYRVAVGRSNGQLTSSESPPDLITLSFLLLAQKKGAKKKAAVPIAIGIDAVHFLPRTSCQNLRKK
jgi:hypothetical protein